MKRSAFLVGVNIFLALYFIFLALVYWTGYRAVWIGVVTELLSAGFLIGLLVSLIVSLKGYIHSGLQFRTQYFFAFWIAFLTCLMLILLTLVE